MGCDIAFAKKLLLRSKLKIMLNLLELIAITLILIANDYYVKADVSDNAIKQCDLPTNLIREIANYDVIVNKIKRCVLEGPCKGTTYNHLADFIDTFGNRIAGSTNLEMAIDYMLNRSVSYKLENVHSEEANVTHWVRGNESAYLLQPRMKKLEMLGLGGSIGTTLDGITAEVIVVNSFEELDRVNVSVKGKIVVYNEDYISYGVTVKYRDYGAVNAAKYGAVASLIRSVTPFSMNTPHTGWQDYDDDVKKIPTACITAEDAHFLRRVQDRGEKIVIRLYMEAKTLSDVISRNTIAEIQGSERPKKFVVVSGHIDSWDVGEGAMDDGAGFMLSWNSLVILKQLNLIPKRTLRAILWTAEEEGLLGAAEYVKSHEDDIENLNFAMESDDGTFEPIGLDFFGSDTAACIMQEILKHFDSLNATSLRRTDDIAPDISFWIQKGIPSATLYNRNENYFWFHHSKGDTMDVEDSFNLDKNTIIWASTAYIIADLSIDMPKK